MTYPVVQKIHTNTLSTALLHPTCQTVASLDNKVTDPYQVKLRFKLSPKRYRGARYLLSTSSMIQRRAVNLVARATTHSTDLVLLASSLSLGNNFRIVRRGEWVTDVLNC